MVPISLLWHDYETWGINTRRDRPAQFAGIRTDTELNEIGEPFMVYCQPTPDVLPDPGACLLTGITPSLCMERGLLEKDFAKQIITELSKPGTIGVGYNTIAFDDEVTRFLLWRNLFDPYAREWQNYCSRWDLLDVVRCTWALRPDGIQWPTKSDGRASLKLEHLTVADGLQHDAAHDALSDVRGTIALARLIRAKQPKLYEFCLKLRNKNVVIDEIGAGRPFIHISRRYGAERGYMGIVWPLAPHPSNRNEMIVWDLTAGDPSELFDLNAETIRQRVFSKKEDMPEGVKRLPLNTIHINRSPIVISKLQTLSPEMAEKWGINMEQTLRYSKIAEQHSHKMHGVWPELYSRPEFSDPVDVDEDLYGGFPNDADKRQLDRFRTMPIEKAAEARPAFHDPRLDELFVRYKCRNFYDLVPPSDQLFWREHCKARMLGSKPGGRTLAEFHESITKAEATATDRDRAILADLRAHAARVEAWTNQS